MKNNFSEDVELGLSSEPKYLQSKYFYDDNGSRIFQEIMRMPEYYLTDSEYEILSMQTKQIVAAANFTQPFNIIELGAGDGFKTFKLLQYLHTQKYDFTYIPVDISKEAMELLTKELATRLPNLKVSPRVGDYFKILDEVKENSDPNLLLFLGSNIGNYSTENAIDLLKLFNKVINKGDKMLVGVDLKKNPITILNAYSDPNGITKKFNLNLLIRINRELGADFKLDDFDFYCHYNPVSAEVKSYIISLKAQDVFVKKLGKTFNFARNEVVWTELSKKYDITQINKMAEKSGFEVISNFMDCKHYFTDSLWVKT